MAKKILGIGVVVLLVGALLGGGAYLLLRDSDNGGGGNRYGQNRGAAAMGTEGRWNGGTQESAAGTENGRGNGRAEGYLAAGHGHGPYGGKADLEAVEDPSSGQAPALRGRRGRPLDWRGRQGQ